MAKSPPPKGERSVKIGPYEVIKRIGAGGMGTVFLALDTDLGRQVALKVLPPGLASKPEMIGRFRQEAQHAAKLRHENIVTLYGCGEHKNLHYLAMEFVEGCNLHEYIDKRGKLSPEDARTLMIQAAKALVAAHEHNIVHRDIKPSNFLLATSGGRTVVKLTDFGLARTSDDLDARMTRTGTTIGTVDYISPEQARNSRSADIRSDIYSLGCTLYHMLAGRPPFPEGDLTERLLKHVEAEPPDILQFNPSVPPGLAQILRKMLAKKPEDRYQTPTELLDELANPPKAPPISAREALELLAEASGEKARSSRASSMQETRRQMKEATASLPTKIPPPTAEMKLHYRKDKNERRKRPEKSAMAADEMRSPVVLEGLGPWLAVIGGLAAVALITMAVLFRWGGKQAPKPETEQIVSTENEKAPEKKSINEQSKKMVDDIRKSTAERREGEEAGASRDELEAMKAANEMPQIDDWGQKVSNEMRGVFEKKEPGSQANALEEMAKNSRETGEQAGPASGRPSTNPNLVPQNSSPSQDGAGATQKQPDPGKNQSPGQASSENQAGTTNPPRISASKTGQPPDQNSDPRNTASAKTNSASETKQPADKKGDSKSTTSGKSNSTQAPQTSSPPAKGNLPQTQPANGSTGSTAGPPRKSAPRARVIQVRRGAGDAQSGSIAAALAQAQAQNTPAVIEIRDNGPFFEPMLEIGNQSVVIRGAAGFRPLIALGDASRGQAAAFLFAVQQGSLALENIDLVLKAPEGDRESGLIRLGEGAILLEDCTLSFTGRSHSGLAAIRMDGAGGAALASCTLRRCVLRGANMTAFDIEGPGCSVLAEESLVVGNERPLIVIQGQTAAKPSTIRMAHTTLVGGQSLCQIDAANDRDLESPTQLIFWDSLLARSGQADGGEMLVLGQNVPLTNVRWRAVNCLYAGWQTLLQYRAGKVPASDLAGWHSLIHLDGGDKALSLAWPSYVPPELDRIPTALFRTAGTAAAFRDSSGRAAVGCSIRDLPPVRMSWPSYTYDRAATPALDTRAPEGAPEIPALNDGRYHGGRVDVSRTDLGEHLQKLHDAGQLAGRVIIHLSGRGNCYVTPFRLKNVQLVLYDDPSGGFATLCPKPGSSADALIRLENGSCELIGVHFAASGGDKGADIGSFVQTGNANLRVIGCRMKGSSGKNAVRTLLAFGGSGDSASDHSRDCVIADSVLQAGGIVLKLFDNGSRLRIQNSVLVAGEDAIVLEPGTLRGPLNLHCVLDHDTVAARQAVVRVQDVTAGPLPLDAFPVQTRGCVFLNPFGELPPRAGLLAFEDQALPHGLVSWQPDGNAYDRQLGYALASREGTREIAFPADAGQRVFGPLGDHRGQVFDGATRDFKLDQPAWERLILPAGLRSKLKGTPPGADFEQLGLSRR